MLISSSKRVKNAHIQWGKGCKWVNVAHILIKRGKECSCSHPTDEGIYIQRQYPIAITDMLI